MPNSATAATTLFALDTVKDWIKIPSSAQGNIEERLCRMADAVTSRIESITRMSFVTRDFTDKYDGDGSNSLFLRHFPVVAISSLTIADSPDATPTVLVEGTDFDVNLRIGEIRLRNYPFFKGFQNVVCTYSAGYGAQDAATLPQDVVHAGLDWIKALYDEGAAGATAASSISIGNSTFILKPGPAPPGVQLVLDHWHYVQV